MKRNMMFPGHADENWAEAEAQLSPGGVAHTGRSEYPNHGDHDAPMAADFRNRFWISRALTLPILVLSPMLQQLVGLRDAIVQTPHPHL